METCIGIGFNEFPMLACDAHAALSILFVNNDCDKIYPYGYKLLNGIGENDDSPLPDEFSIGKNQIQLYKNGFELTPEYAALVIQRSLTDYFTSHTPYRSPSHDFDLEEWSIPYKDLYFGEPFRFGQFGTIYKGNWHGEVLIHTFKDTQDNDNSNFWDTIDELCMVRHENIVLFMGVCVDAPDLSVITSMIKGPSLFEHIHVKQEVISPPNRISIARQIAQAMGYLHARGIVHKRLTSNNIILESKVKICLIDQGSDIYNYNGSNYGLITKGYLTYLCPQLIRSIKVEPPFVKYDGRFCPESDVYAFGTILFELMTGTFPYQRRSSHSIIWLIGSGHHEDVHQIKGTREMRRLVSSCWSPLSGQRPEFSQVVKQLQENISVNKKRSSSEPERLNKIGLI